MNPPRLVLVTRRFWPLLDEAEGLLTRLAVALADKGLAVTVLTARWQADWPYQINFEGVQVLRLPYSNRRGWGTLRYMRAVTGWLRGQQHQFDVVCTSGLKHDAYATLSAGQGRFPVVLRVDKAGLSGDCHWQLDATFGYRIKRRCFKADAFLAAGRPVERELIAAGYPRDRIHYCPNGVDLLPQNSAELKAAARESLAEAHPCLSLDDRGPLVLFAGEVHISKGLKHLIEAWRHVVERRPKARLWIAGDGPHLAALEAQIDALGLRPWVVMPGVFDDEEDLLRAADIFVLPSLEEGMPYTLLRAMAAGLPIVASDIPGNRALLEHERQGLLVPAENSDALEAAIERLLDDAPLAARLGLAARQRAEEEFPWSAMVERHVELFESLVHNRQGVARP